MKMNIKGKTLLKNGFLFQEQFFINNDFAASLKILIDKWNPSYKNQEKIVFCWDYKDYQEVRKRNKIAYDRRVNFINSLTEGRVSEFQKDIFTFIDRFNFGKEWLNTIADFILSTWLYPPTFNLHIDDRVLEQKKVLLELNPDTSFDNIKEAWPEIKKQQKLNPSTKRRYFTVKSFENLGIALMDKKERARGINETFDATYEINDMDISGAIWADVEDDSLIADRRRTANLRQIRHRLNKKTS